MLDRSKFTLITDPLFYSDYLITAILYAKSATDATATHAIEQQWTSEQHCVHQWRPKHVFPATTW